jgi:hypothetical protein
MLEQNAKTWFYSLEPSERNRLSLKYRNTYGYGTFKDYVFLEIYNQEQSKNIIFFVLVISNISKSKKCCFIPFIKLFY